MSAIANGRDWESQHVCNVCARHELPYARPDAKSEECPKCQMESFQLDRTVPNTTRSIITTSYTFNGLAPTNGVPLMGDAYSSHAQPSHWDLPGPWQFSSPPATEPWGNSTPVGNHPRGPPSELPFLLNFPKPSTLNLSVADAQAKSPAALRLSSHPDGSTTGIVLSNRPECGIYNNVLSSPFPSNPAFWEESAPEIVSATNLRTPTSNVIQPPPSPAIEHTGVVPRSISLETHKGSDEKHRKEELFSGRKFWVARNVPETCTELIIQHGGTLSSFAVDADFVLADLGTPAYYPQTAESYTIIQGMVDAGECKKPRNMRRGREFKVGDVRHM